MNEYLHLLNRGLSESKTDVYTNSPLLTASALRVAQGHGLLQSQYGLLARVLAPARTAEEAPVTLGQASCLFWNTVSPSSTFICGSQGSGKSHTLSCLLENSLFQSNATVLPNPLTALVFHYDTFISDDGGSPCEAAYLSSVSDVRVRVLCAPTNITTIRRTYSRLNVEVLPLQLKDTDLNTKRMLDLMVTNKDDGSMPLYIHVVHRILREMRMDQQRTGKSFNYATFKTKIAGADLTPTQLVPLLQRLSVLESFMWQAKEHTGKNKKSEQAFIATEWLNEPCVLTIVDLSCPCITPETACSLFNICLSIFIEQDISCGRVIALDEAHKYMTTSPESAAFTNTILSAVRLQRHLGVRVIVATQDPTVSLPLLDLCSVTIVHRFTSPSWVRVLQKHLTTLDSNQSEQGNGQELFQSIVGLRTGEALIFAPSTAKAESSITEVPFMPYFKVRIRARVSADRGKSVLAK